MKDDTYLLRQINQSWLDDNRVTSQAFTPTRKDAGHLSFYDGDQITPEDAWYHFNQRFRSLGVMAVTVSECKQLEVQPIPDPAEFPEHVLVQWCEQFSR